MADATDIGVGDILDIDSENMLVTGVNPCTVVRGFNNTQIAEHDSPVGGISLTSATRGSRTTG